MKAGAVIVERSPLKDAIDYSSQHPLGEWNVHLHPTLRKLPHEPFAAGGTADPSFSAMLCRVVRECRVQRGEK
jgi:hypothetical protein